MTATLEDLRAAIGGRLLQGRLDDGFAGASIDSRSLRAGNLFFAVKGERTDGHVFVTDANRRGAAGAVVEKMPVRTPASRALARNFPLIRVESTVRALQRGAAWYRSRFHLPVIAITGSNGKTTVKDMTAWLLRGALRADVLASRGNHNNHLGVPLTLFGLSAETRAAVLELAMNHGGEIRRLARLAAPGTGVLLNAHAAHLMSFRSVSEIARAKAELLEELPAGGWAILNADDGRVWARRGSTAARVIGFGVRTGDVRAERVRLNRRGEPSFVLRTPGGSAEASLSLPGAHNAVNAAAAAAVGWTFGMAPTAIAHWLGAFRSAAPFRLERRRLHGGGLAVVDCYNANPGSYRAAFSCLRGMKARRPVLVLGEMRELGSHSARAHRAVGVEAASLDPRLLVGVGGGARGLVTAARRAGAARALWVKSPEEAIEVLAPEMGGDSVILFKASRKVEMERLVEKLEGNN